MFDVFFYYKCISFYQPESLDLQGNEFVLSKDLMVYLWTQYRTFSGKEPAKMAISSLLMMTFMMILSYLKRMVNHLSTVLLRQLIFLNIGADQL